MSAADAADRSSDSGRSASIWLAFAAIIAVAIALAWAGASPLRGETTASGLQFRTIEEGSGPLIKSVDGVLVEYEGRLEDGTVFDSSEGRGPTPMIPSQVISGFGEALQMMQEGGRYRVRIPSELAYGSSPPPGAPIPPDADLTFDVEIVQVVPNAALLMQQQQGAIPGQDPTGQIEPGQSQPGQSQPGQAQPGQQPEPGAQPQP